MDARGNAIRRVLGDANMSPHMLNVKTIVDDRGSLSVPTDLPFKVNHFFVLHGFEQESNRGGHAHYSQRQIILCLFGCAVVLVGGPLEKPQTYILRSPDEALYVPQLNWVEIRLSAGSSVIVLASQVYDDADYIRYRSVFDALA